MENPGRELTISRAFEMIQRHIENRGECSGRLRDLKRALRNFNARTWSWKS
jgi:hypothetical protein